MANPVNICEGSQVLFPVGEGCDCPCAQSDWAENNRDYEEYIVNRAPIRLAGNTLDALEGGSTVENDLINNRSSGAYSHAEGSENRATDNYAHAEGFQNIGSGIASHVEGAGNVTGGYTAHAEGLETGAYGRASHAEGYKTKADGRSTHVFGEYNTVNESVGDQNERGRFVEMVGNGFEGYDSNARTLDWLGNEELAGNLTINGTPTDNKHAATVKYVQDYVAEHGGGGGGSKAEILATLGYIEETLTVTDANGNIVTRKILTSGV